ncbi:MAG: hypothetical protein U0359_25330 [Byssovorax sp.]
MRRALLSLVPLAALLAIGCEQAPLSPVRVAIKPPAAPSPPWGFMVVHIQSAEPVTLRYEQLGGGWSTVCTSPCGERAKIGRSYRLFSGDSFASVPFDLDGAHGSEVFIDVPPIPRGPGSLRLFEGGFF